jgi:hypothetical protein
LGRGAARHSRGAGAGPNESATLSLAPFELVNQALHLRDLLALRLDDAIRKLAHLRIADAGPFAGENRNRVVRARLALPLLCMCSMNDSMTTAMAAPIISDMYSRVSLTKMWFHAYVLR